MYHNLVNLVITMHCWKANLKSNDTTCWRVSLVEYLESRAHFLTSFLINFFSSSHRPFAIQELLKFLSLTRNPQIKHITQQQKTSHGSTCIFLEPQLQFLIVGPAPLHPNFFFNLEFLSLSGPEQNSKHQKGSG